MVSYYCRKHLKAAWITVNVYNFIALSDSILEDATPISSTEAAA